MQEIINRISVELNIHPDKVEKAIRAQFEFVKEVMESDSMRNIQLQYLGKFAIKPGRQTILDKVKNKD